MSKSSLDERNQKRKIRKISLLIVSIVITTIILITETYAWFVGLSEVSVNDMTISISSVDGLELSLDANTWSSSTLSISQSAITTNINSSYSGHKNKWVSTSTGAGLVPISSSGIIQSPSGRLEIYGKSSMNSTAGGYNVVASKISNTSTEADGYVAFDLFIRNGKNGTYDATNYTDDMGEAIYLTTTSIAKVSSAGQATDNGIANSLRVAFIRIGMVSSSATKAEAQGITCSTATGVTPLCSFSDAIIWEPNDKSHNATLVTNFNNKFCVKRTGATTYSGACTPQALNPVDLSNDGTAAALANNKYYQTYTVNKAISGSNQVGVYDGLNSYTGKIGDTNFLKATNTFTDTEKNLTGDSRPILFKLVAYSITKVRVYIYLEGQDVDNYDLITKGKSIDVKFGFTKDKYNISST